MVTAMGSTSKISINIQKSKKLVSYSRLMNMPKTDINGRIYDVASIFVNCLRGKIFFLKPLIMVASRATIPTAINAYMAYQYGAYGPRMGSSANRKRKTVKQMLKAELIFFIFCRYELGCGQSLWIFFCNVVSYKQEKSEGRQLPHFYRNQFNTVGVSLPAFKRKE